MVTRREFLERATGTAAAIAAGLVPGGAGAADEAVEWRNRRPEMAYRRLGRTGFMVSEIVMGGNDITPDNYEHVLLALDKGLNYLDTSPAYGNGKSEEGYAKVLKARPRDQFFLTSKVSPWDNNRNQRYQEIFKGLPEAEQGRLRRAVAEEIEHRGVLQPDYIVNYSKSQPGQVEAAILANLMEAEYGGRIDRERDYKQLILDSVDASLKRLGTDHLDILMCPHGASSPYEVTRYPETFEAFEVLKKAGKVRHLGVSSHNDPAAVLGAALDAKVYSVAMVAYNLINAHHFDEVLDRARDEDFGVIAMKVARPFYPGPGKGEADPERLRALHREVEGDWSVPQKAFLWALREPRLSAVIANMVDAQQVEEDLRLPLARKRG